MDLILKCNLDFVKMYLNTKNEVSMSTASKVIALTDTKTHTDTQTQPKYYLLIYPSKIDNWSFV